MNEKEIEKMAMERVREIKYENLDKFYSTLDELNCTNEDKVIFTLVRYGVKLDSLNTIKWTDINKQDMIINLDNIHLPIDERFLGVVKKLNKDNETILDSDLTKEKIYMKTMIISKNNNTPRISLGALSKNRIFDLLISRYNLNYKLTYNDVKEILGQVYGLNRRESILSMIKTFENTMNIKVTKAI